ncbi:Glycosyl transferase [Macleaya cordata]|uniref:Glycosyl transferase n=1 Tax=Macleaya cordata TaxID=56857 RepID=A0A200R1E5_MACCD|nr:Glycosyl transferase [Macleaya cordata]
MGSLENGVPLKRAPLFRSLSRSERQSFGHRPRSRFARFFLLEKVDYLQWICTIGVFLFVIILFQAFLPGSVMEKSGDYLVEQTQTGLVSRDSFVLKEFDGLNFGEGIRFDPSKLLEKLERESKEVNLSSALSRPVFRSGIRKPQLALVFADLSVEPGQLLMVSVAVSLMEIGYAIQVYSLEDGPAGVAWRSIGVPITIIENSNKPDIAVDWLNYDGILVNSLEARDVVSCLVQEPFKSVPVIWTVHEKTLAFRLRQYTSNGQTQLVSDWKQAFIRATVVVFPNYFLPMMYSTFDAGNYFVIPGSPNEAWEADSFMASYNRDDLRVKMGYSTDDFVIAIVGSEFSYSGLWLEHAFVLQALLPLFSQFQSDDSSSSRLKVRLLSGNSTSNYKLAMEAIAINLGYPKEHVEQIGIDGDVNSLLSTADIVIYGSFLEEQSFPEILIQAMCFGKPIIAPDLAMIKKYVDDRVNGYLFPKENIGILTQVLFQAISNTKLSPLARNIASIAKDPARNLMVSETIEGYAFILEKVLKFPSEVAPPKAITDIPPRLKEEWQWHLFEEIESPKYLNRTLRSYSFLDKVEELWNESHMENSGFTSAISEAFSYTDWEEEKAIEMINARKRREEEELKDRTDQPHGTWEEVYRGAKRADRAKNDLRERDDRELERTGQPLCIYEPYHGEGTWPFLHNASLYRGIGLSTKGRRPGADDVDAPSRLPLLNNPYYRNILGEYGAFFAIANRVDRVHKSAWIGFQSWRAAARKVSLSKVAENALLNAIEERKHGDTLYFWARMDKDPRNPLQQDFWSFCDAINAGNCRFAVSEALRRMYGIKNDLDCLPPMPINGDTWSVMHSWALPTRSFLEFVMFSRMFVDALDAQMYDEHHQSGRCYLSLSKDRHCYSRVLELLVNVWSYHSARRMVFVNPETGAMQEQHKLKSRRGQMWVRWFSYTTLKSMDEDLAEESDSDKPTRRWLWPSTGEVFWQGIFERERNIRNRQKEKRKQQSKDKISRMRKRVRQKAIGKYVKPPPEDEGDSNSTALQ